MRPDRLARLHRAVDAQAGERVRAVPWTEGGLVVGGVDPDRPTVEFDAVVTDIPKATRSRGGAGKAGAAAEQRSALHSIKFTTAALPYRLRSGDHVVLLARDKQELKVNVTDPFGTGRTIARLEPLKRSPPQPA